MSTLKHIAQELDLSISLVSKVLNRRLGTTGASPRTIAMIDEAAQRLNYRKNLSAESLATGRQRAIGIFMHRHGLRSSAMSEETIIGAANRAANAGQRLVLRLFESAEDFQAGCEEANLNTLDGLIIAGVMHKDLIAQLERLRAEGMPVVTMHHQRTSDSLPNVGCDPVRLGEIATQHLLERGCKRIAHIRSHVERHEGYEKALREAGVPILPELIFDTLELEDSFGHGADAARHWLDQGIAFDGLTAQSDEQAATAMIVLQEAGKRIPQDVKVIGMDNSPFCEIFPVSLSSISQEDQKRAAIAVDLLLAMVDGKEVQSQDVEPVVFQRNSSGGLPERSAFRAAGKRAAIATAAASIT